MIYVMFGHKDYDEKYIYSFEKGIFGVRYENVKRANTAFIFEVEGFEKKYNSFETAILKEIFYNKIYSFLAVDNEITFQNNKLLNLVTDKGYRDGIQK